MANLTNDQVTYLNGLRDGNVLASGVVRRDNLSDAADQDLENFKAFLADKGHPEDQQQPADLGLTIARKDLLRLLFYAEDIDRNCLIIQSCFGFDTQPVKDVINADRVPPEDPIVGTVAVGRVVLIQKGNFQQRTSRADDDFFGETADTVYRNAFGETEFFLNMDIRQRLPIDQARTYIDNFLTMYTEEQQAKKENPIIHGFLLPVRALINIFTAPTDELGRATELTVQWGITKFNVGDPEFGNFSLFIGIGDLKSGPVIEFRSVSIAGTGINDCPPNTGCKVKSS